MSKILRTLHATSLPPHHSRLITHGSSLTTHPRAIKKRKALSLQSKGDSLRDERRFIGKVEAIPLKSKKWLFRADIATAVEDILNGQRSTTAVRIEILTRTEGHKKFCSRLKTEFLQDKNFLKIRIDRIYIVFLHK